VALAKDRGYPLRLERRRLTLAGAFASNESEAKAKGIERPAVDRTGGSGSDGTYGEPQRG
jgi:hypothetical protein